MEGRRCASASSMTSGPLVGMIGLGSRGDGDRARNKSRLRVGIEANSDDRQALAALGDSQIARNPARVTRDSAAEGASDSHGGAILAA
jgi:hypothetical protein